MPGPTLVLEVRAFCPCRKCCGPNACGVTKSGRPAVGPPAQRIVAADLSRFPIGTRLRIAGEVWTVLDTGPHCKGNKIEVLLADHETAKRWGVRWLTVEVAGTGPSPAPERTENP